MIRNLRLNGLVLIGALATGLLMASPGLAQEPAIRADGPVTLSATETGASEANGFTMFEESIRCPGSTYTGHKLSATPHELIPNGATAATITPAYKNCQSSGGLPVTIDLNGCDYVVNIGAEASEHKYAATTDIVCPEGQSIKLTVFSSSSHALKLCTYAISPKSGLTGLTARTTTPPGEGFDLEGATASFHVAKSGLCGSSTTTQGIVSLDLAVKGRNGAGEGTAVAIDDEESPPQPAIRSDGPVTLTATETGASEANGFTMFGESIRCPGSTYTGHKYNATPHALISSGATAATITPAYKQTSNNCKHTPENVPATIDLNGCDYVVNIGAETSEHKYAATTDIVCPEGKSIQLTVFSGAGHSFKLCTYAISAQTGLTGLTARVTTPATEDFDIEGTASGVHVVRSGAACEETTTTEGEIDLDLTVKGLNGEGKSTPVSIDDEDLGPAIRADGPVTLTATETGASEANGFTMFGESIRCPGSTYTGHKLSATPHELIPNGATAATITPAYKQTSNNCKHTPENLPATIDLNGCDYVIKIGSETSEHKYAATTDIVCPEGQSIKLTVFSGTGHSFKLCTYTIKAQTGLTGLSARTTTAPAEDFDLEGAASGVHVVRSGAACEETTTTGGKIDLDLTVKGKNSDGFGTPVAIDDEDLPAQTGIRSDGPVTLSATETGASEANGFTMFEESIRCPGSTYTGHKYNVTPHALISSGATAATITPTYKNCVSGELPLTIDMNGCDYAVAIGGEVSEHKYAASTDIACPEGKSIQLTVFSSSSHALRLCTMAISPQTGFTGLYVKSTTSPAEDFDLEGTINGIHVSKSGLCGSSTTTEGKVDLDLTVKGLNEEGKATPVAIDDEDLP